RFSLLVFRCSFFVARFSLLVFRCSFFVARFLTHLLLYFAFGASASISKRHPSSPIVRFLNPHP
ncbi:hypothetical protein, partial [Gordonibacter massiliensis (ex Traore et al. 2017)]|uniref:hypothetical protein n=1 Tax=Gordonibacter massiliensis (ex Traore et al. 2017) TaxID=1841863 RepID=UPI001C8B4C47